MLTIDGSYLEGGGQIVRTALALSTLTGIPFRCTDIRKGRKDAGLKAQHLTGITALEEMCGAKCEGAALGSTEIVFYPKPIKKFRHEINIGTAGSISLVLQSLLPPLLFAEKKISLTIIGGTDGLWAMPVDYMQAVLLPQLQRFAKIEMKITKRGYYPKGGGIVELRIHPKHHLYSFDDLLLTLQKEVPPYDLKQQKTLLCIKGISHASIELQNAKVSERQTHAAKVVLQNMNCPLKIDIAYAQTLSTGSGITLYAIFGRDEEDQKNPVRLGADALGEKGKKAEVVGEEAAKKLLQEITNGATVDTHLTDNLLPYLALAGGKVCTSEITMHTKTNQQVIEQFLGNIFTVEHNCISVLTAQEENL